jgi:hypothetical protein
MHQVSEYQAKGNYVALCTETIVPQALIALRVPVPV